MAFERRCNGRWSVSGLYEGDCHAARQSCASSNQGMNGARSTCPCREMPADLIGESGSSTCNAPTTSLP